MTKYKYTHDTERWLRSQASFYRVSLYRASHNRELAGTFTACADEVKRLREEVAALRVAAVHIYNSGYLAGHHYTVEGGYVDIHSNDMASYHAEEVAELLTALVGEE